MTESKFRSFSGLFLVLLKQENDKHPSYFSEKLEIRYVERGICPIATLYSLAAAFQRLMLL